MVSSIAELYLGMRSQLLRIGDSFDEFVYGSRDDLEVLYPYRLLNIISNLDLNYGKTGKLAIKAFWRTLLANLFDGHHPAPANLIPSFVKWFALKTSMRMAILGKIAEGGPQSVNLTIQGHKYSPKARQIFHT
jgi:hypothetical protein